MGRRARRPTLAELEAVTMFQTLGAIMNLPFTIGEKVMDLMAGMGRAKNRAEREARRPAEHRQAEESASATEKKEEEPPPA